MIKLTTQQGRRHLEIMFSLATSRLKGVCLVPPVFIHSASERKRGKVFPFLSCYIFEMLVMLTLMASFNNSSVRYLYLKWKKVLNQLNFYFINLSLRIYESLSVEGTNIFIFNKSLLIIENLKIMLVYTG